jgi:D-alanyl-D-alanine carboxypeptidase (penicillin-binding protein 5/6)
MMSRWLAMVASLLVGGSAASQEVQPVTLQGAPAPLATVSVPLVEPLPRLPFKSYFLADFATGRVLAAESADARLEPASLTKLMTAYVVFRALEQGRIQLADKARVSERAWRMSGTRMFIELNSYVAIEDLLRGLLIQSGNDAAVALAEHMAGSVEAFADEMNAAAKALGMENSAFRNPHGLSARGHYTSAHDLGILAHAIIAEYPQFYRFSAERQFEYNGIKQRNRNALLWRDPSVDGMKTGFTDGAGYCLVTSATRDGMRLIAVVMGAESPRVRTDGAQKLLDYGFGNFETHKLYAAGQSLDSPRVRGGDIEFAELGLEKDLYVTIPRGAFAALGATMNVLAELAAPLAAGARVGEVMVSFGDEPLTRTPLVVLSPIADGGAWARLRDSLASFLE